MMKLFLAFKTKCPLLRSGHAMKHALTILMMACLVATTTRGFAEETGRAPLKRPVPSPAATTALLTFGINTTVATVCYFAFWRGEPRSFHFKNDGWFDRHQYALGADKLGHGWSAYQLTNVSAWAYKQLGVPEAWANVGGMLNAQLALLVMEIGDGMSPWGFSRQDVLSNAAGAVFAYTRLRWAIVRDLTDYKWTYVMREPVPLHGGPGKPSLFENYDDWTFWLILRGKRLLPRPLKFLGLGVGYHTEGFHDLRPRLRTWLVGLDVDWTELVRPRKPVLQGIVNVANIYHLPFLPAWKKTTHIR
jgi:hypothetical protein